MQEGVREFVEYLQAVGLATPQTVLKIAEWNEKKSRGLIEISNEYGKFKFEARRAIINGQVKWVFKPITS